MKCAICGADAIYMVAKEHTVFRIMKGFVNEYSGRCKNCRHKKE